MRASGGDPATIHQQDPVGANHRRQPVRNDNGCAVAHQPLQRRLHRRLGPRIQRACRLVEKKQPRIAQDRACDSDPLALATRQPHALFPYRRVIPVLERGDEIVSFGLLRGGDDLVLAGVRPAETDIVAHAGGEQRRLLRHQPDILPYVAKGEVTQILAAQPHSPRTRVIEPQQQMEQGRFSSPARPDKRHPLAARDFEIDRADGWPAGSGRIREIDSLKPAGRLAITAKRQRRGRLRQIGSCLQCLGNPFRGAGGPLQLAGEFRQEAGRGRDQKGVEDERGQVAGGYAPGDQVLAADPEDRGDA